MIYLDLLRCLAILLVILAHSMTSVLCNPSLYGTRTWYLCMLQNEWNRTNVPLFFMISGCLILRSSKTRNVTAFYQSKLPRLLIPLAVWNLVYCLGHAWSDGTRLELKEYLGTLLQNGSEYHFWYIYTLLGLYLLAPFLKRIVDQATTGELSILLILILFPGALRPLLNMISPIYLRLFDPLMEGYAGYFLLGYLLGSNDLSRRGRIAVYLGGAAGYTLSTVGNLLAASPEANPLPFNTGYYLNHYLCAAAIFVFIKQLLSGSSLAFPSASKFWNIYLPRLSSVTFGVYWIHVLILTMAVRLLVKLSPSPSVRLLLSTVAATVISFAVALICSRIPGIRRLFT